MALQIWRRFIQHPERYLLHVVLTFISFFETHYSQFLLASTQAQSCMAILPDVGSSILGPFLFLFTTYPTSLMSVYLFFYHFPTFYHIGPRSTNSVLSELCVRFTYF